MKMTKNDLVKLVNSTGEELDDAFSAHGIDFKEVAARHENAKRELAARFGVAVGYGGILHTLPENARPPIVEE